MAVDSAARDAAAGKLAVVLEVDAVQLLAARYAANFAHAVFHIRPLLGGQKQRRVRILPNGHVVEIPREDAALGNEQIQKFVARNDLIVFARVADGYAEGNAVAAHQVHRGKRLLEVPVAAPAVVCVFKALDAHRDEEVAHTEHFLAEFVVNQRAVGKGVEGNIAVLFAEPDNILLAHERLSAGKQACMRAELFALGQNAVHFLECEALLVTVFCRPAAGAAHVARGGRVHQNQPRDVDIILCRRLLRHMVAADAAFIDGVGQERFENVRVVVANQALGIMRPFAVRVVCNHAKRLERVLAPHVAVELFHHVHKVGGNLRRVLRLPFFDEVVENCLKRLSFGGVG